MTRATLLLFLAVLAAGCGGLRPAPLAPVAWTEQSDPDSIAQWVVRGCSRALRTDRQCAERALYAVIEPAGVGKAMAALDRVIARAPALAPDAHGLAHGMGIAAYRTPETVGRTFASCPPTQMSGCYHGVIQGYFLGLQRDSGTVGPEVLNAVCEEHRSAGPLYFQCAHGLGHGVMALESHHLPRALARCDEVREAWVRETCYGGAFMENIVAVTHPHHTAEAHSALGGHGDASAGHGAAGHHPAPGGEHAGHAAPAAEHAGHAAPAGEHAGNSGHAAPAAEHAGHSGHAAPAAEHVGHAEHATDPLVTQPWTPLRSDDLMYPCTVLGEKYQAQCYEMQSSAAVFMTNGNVGRVAQACSRVPEARVRACYASLGRDVSALAGLGPERSVQLCREAGPAAMPVCVAGVAKTFVNRAGKPTEGLAFCRVAPAGEAKAECYRAVGEMSRSLATVPEREALCETVEADAIEPCRAGAALPRRDTR